MDTPFIYDKYVTGRDFIGHAAECRTLGALIAQGSSVVIYEPPKTGKTSLIQQTLFNIRVKGAQFIVAQIHMLNVRTIRDFLVKYGTAVIRSVASTPGEYGDILGRHLAGTCFTFDPDSYSRSDTIVTVTGEITDSSIASMLDLPKKVSEEKGLRMIVILDEFQNIMMTEDGDRICRIMEASMAGSASDREQGVSYIFCGSMVNAMKDIFETRHLFGRKVERVRLMPADEREIIDHIVKGFLTGGKTVERDLLLGMCGLFRNNQWYINHFVSICDSISKGYIIESMLVSALNAMISIHEPEFRSTMNGLTDYQTSYLRAVLDGVTKFSSGEVIREYGLNSSANVKRLREALMKKEIIVFDEEDIPSVQDPLFEFWVRKFYFEMETR